MTTETQTPVLTLLEWRKARKETRDERLPSSMPTTLATARDLIDFYRSERDADWEADDFYATLFKPELIVEWFEGWVIDGDRDFVSNNHDLIEIGFKLQYSINTGFTSRIPHTLADFISDCKRAGLSLFWKPEVVKENTFLIIGG